jgi:4-hydroxybenzoate polyprenyltransferase
VRSREAIVLRLESRAIVRRSVQPAGVLTMSDPHVSREHALPGNRATWRGHFAIARVDHWFKNVFVLPGIVFALGTDPSVDRVGLGLRIITGLLSVCLIASSNYTLNELIDAPYDQHHPTKHSRPVPAGQVNVPLGYVQWLILLVAGAALGLTVSVQFTLVLLALWVMGCVYNIPPVRSKDLPYVDVLSEAINNPIRMLAGWFIVTTATIAPASLLLSYWMIGAYFMALKRFAEYRNIGDARRAAAYRKSFRYFTTERLLVSVMFYASAAMLFFGAFCMRYRLELILAFPAIALVMAVYLNVALKDNSAAQHPEKLYREWRLMWSVVAAALLIGLLLSIDLPIMQRVFTPTAPTSRGGVAAPFEANPR